GGLPVGAFGGSEALMNQMAPVGPVYQAGTLSGNPLAMAAGIATLRLLDDPAIYAGLETHAARLGDGLVSAAKSARLNVTANRVGSMMTLFFTGETVRDYESAKTSDTAMYGRYFSAMLDRGVYFAPSQFECGFVSLAHSNDDIDATLATAKQVF